MLEGSILRQLELAHQGGTRPIRFGVYYKNTLVALCHALEDCILTAGSAPLVMTAFQRGKWYLQEADRYHDLAQRSREVVIMAAPDGGFAEHPTSQLPNVELVHLDPTDPVAQEWHLIICAPSYTAMVLCQELSAADYGPAGVPQEDRERKFYGLWTFEPALVQETMTLAIAHVGTYNPELQARLTQHLEAVNAAAATAQNDDLNGVVSRVIDYLRISQEDLGDTAPSYLLPSPKASLDQNLVSNELQAFLRMAQLVDLTNVKNPGAAAEVASLAEMMGQLLDLPPWQLHRLKLAGLLYRVALPGIGDMILSPALSLPYRDEAFPSCPLTCPILPGVQVLRAMPQLQAIATIITHQSEWWNGSGQPSGLAGDEIPLESRILGLVAAFQRRLNRYRMAEPESGREGILAKALAECQGQQSDRWDPKLIETLGLMVMGLQQGFGMPEGQPRIVSSLWLLDPHPDEHAVTLDYEHVSGSTLYATEEIHGH